MGQVIDLMHGDCLELMKDIPDNSIDMCLTDPPYNLTMCDWDKFEDYVTDNLQASIFALEGIFWEIHRVTKPNGAVLLFCAEPFASRLRLANINYYRYDWIWKKTEPTGHFNAKKRPLVDMEKVAVFYKKQCLYNPQKTTGHKLKTSKRICHNSIYNDGNKEIKYSSTERYPKCVLEYSRCRQKNKLHPTQKPVALLEYLIKTYTLENETVLDFTMGSGSTGVAAKNLNRKFIGIEKDETYFNIAKGRIDEC